MATAENAYLFQRDHEGFNVCFYENCGQRMKANFSRHVNKHEEQGDSMDLREVRARRERWTAQQQRANGFGTSSGAVQSYGAAAASSVLSPASSSGFGALSSRDSGPTRTCGHDEHDELFPDLPRVQPESAFYSHSNKCKKCYIYLQTERTRRVRLGLPMLPLQPRRRRRPDGHMTPSRDPLQQQQQQLFALPHAPKRNRLRRADSSASAEDSVPESAAFVMFPGATGSTSATVAAVNDAVLALPIIVAGDQELAAGLRHLAYCGLLTRAILNEIRDHPFAKGAQQELDQLDADVEQKSLRQFGDLVTQLLTNAMYRHAGQVESAQIERLLQHFVLRLGEARQILASVAHKLRFDSACGHCNNIRDPSPGNGSPIVCQGSCARVFHAGCVGAPGETGWVCEPCRTGGPHVAHWDNMRCDYYVNLPASSSGVAVAAVADDTYENTVGWLLRQCRDFDAQFKPGTDD